MMANLTLTVELLVYAFTLWLGLYLLGRDLSKAALRLAGLGLTAYAFALAADALQAYAPSPLPFTLGQYYEVLIPLPAILWSGALLHLLPEESEQKNRLTKLWKWAYLPAMLLILLARYNERGFFEGWFQALLIAALGTATVYLAIAVWRAQRKGRLGLTLVSGLLFTLSAVLLFFPPNWIPPVAVLLAVGLDLELLGLGIAIFDAFDEGQHLWRDMLRSLQTAFFVSLLFGGQVVLAMALSTGITLGMLVLLSGTLAAAITLSIFSNRLLGLIDRVALFRAPGKRREHAQLRAAARAQLRLDTGVDFTQMDTDEFTRLTRRALSHYGDLPRLASNPLTLLPMIDQRLRAQNRRTDTLQRASELRALLAESIQRLKPDGEEEFGSTDAWRYYNALYFPYVAGLKPYRRRSQNEDLEKEEIQALTWFQREVPERTLHNWQNAAAGLVARDLLEQMGRT